MKVMKKQMVLRTWKGVLQDEKAMQKDWITQDGVLVGIVLGRKRPRGRH